jgi:hypothetical protein
MNAEISSEMLETIGLGHIPEENCFGSHDVEAVKSRIRLIWFILSRAMVCITQSFILPFAPHLICFRRAG